MGRGEGKGHGHGAPNPLQRAKIESINGRAFSREHNKEFREKVRHMVDPDTGDVTKAWHKDVWLRNLYTYSSDVIMGLVIGLVAWSMHFGYTILAELRIKATEHQLEDGGSIGMGWLVYMGCMLAMCLVSAMCVLPPFGAPHAKSSGIPPLICELNGTHIPKLLSPKVILCKVIGAIMSVGSGFACGPEGPIIHLSGGLGRQTLKFLSRKFPDKWGHMSNTEDLRDFTASGTGAGVSAAFMAPLAGVIFTVEEASSYFSLVHLHKTFISTTTAYFVVWTFNTYVMQTTMVEFSVASGDACAYKYYHIPMFAFVGVVGGVLGAVFNFYTFTLCSLRRDYIDPSQLRSWLQVLMVALITGSIFVTVPGWFECRDMSVGNFLDKEQVNDICIAEEISSQYVYLSVNNKQDCKGDDVSKKFCNPSNFWYSGECPECDTANGGTDVVYCNTLWYTDPMHTHDTSNQCAPWHTYWCNQNVPNVSPAEKYAPERTEEEGGGARVCGYPNYKADIVRHHEVELERLKQFTCKDKQYNAVASLFLIPGPEAVKNLLTRGLPYLFKWHELVCAFCFYFLLAGLTTGIAMPTGLVVPYLFIGSAMGRLIGLGVHEWFQEAGWENSTDPGVFAIVGAAAFMAGSGQIMMFLAVVTLEITNDLTYMPAIALAAIIGCFTGRQLCHGLYHELIAVAGLPYLELDPDVIHETQVVSLVMGGGRDCKKPLRTLEESLGAKVALEKIWRMCVDDGQSNGLGMNAEWSERKDVLKHHYYHGYPVTNSDGNFVGCLDIDTLIRGGVDNETDTIADFMDAAAITAGPDWPLDHAYQIFRRMGLRRMTVVDGENKPIGIVTRLNLMPFYVHERVHQTHLHDLYEDSHPQDSKGPSTKQEAPPQSSQGKNPLVVTADEQHDEVLTGL